MNGISLTISVLALVIALLSGWPKPAGATFQSHAEAHYHPDRYQYAELVLTSQIEVLLNDWKSRYYPRVMINPEANHIVVEVILARGQEKVYDSDFISTSVELRVERVISATEFGWMQDFAVHVVTIQL